MRKVIQAEYLIIQEHELHCQKSLNVEGTAPASMTWQVQIYSLLVKCKMFFSVPTTYSFKSKHANHRVAALLTVRLGTKRAGTLTFLIGAGTRSLHLELLHWLSVVGWEQKDAEQGWHLCCSYFINKLRHTGVGVCLLLEFCPKYTFSGQQLCRKQ